MTFDLSAMSSQRPTSFRRVHSLLVIAVICSLTFDSSSSLNFFLTVFAGAFYRQSEIDLRQYGLFIWEKLLVGRNVLPSKQPCLLSDFVQLSVNLLSKDSEALRYSVFYISADNRVYSSNADTAHTVRRPFWFCVLLWAIGTVWLLPFPLQKERWEPFDFPSAYAWLRPRYNSLRGIKSYRLLVSFRNNRPILSAVAETMLIAHLRQDIIKGL